MSHQVSSHTGGGILFGGFARQVKLLSSIGSGGGDRGQRCRLVDFILENAPGHLNNRSRLFLEMLQAMNAIATACGAQAYSVFGQVIDSHECGASPQRQLRVFNVGIFRAGRSNVRLDWPCRRPAPPLSSIFDSDEVPLSTYEHYPLPKTEVARARAQEAFDDVSAKASAEYRDPRSYTCAVDTEASSQSHSLTTDASPTLTRARGSALAFWSLQHGRRLFVRNLLRLQVVDLSKVAVLLSARQMGALIGNSFNVTMLTLIIEAAILAYAEG